MTYLACIFRIFVIGNTHVGYSLAGISRTTLSKIEKGDGGVSFGVYAKVFFILGMIERLSDLADPSFDKLGLILEAENLPRRIRIPKKEKEGY